MAITERSRLRLIFGGVGSARSTRTAVLVLALVVVALAGTWLGLVLGAHTDIAIGPVQARVAVQPSLSGQTVVDIPPLGTLQISSHRGPLRLDVAVQAINQRDVAGISRNPGELHGFPDQVAHQVRQAVLVAALRGLGAALAASMVIAALAFRRAWRVVVAGGISLATLAASGGIAAMTWRPNAILEPRYTGLLTSAPSLIGTTQNILTSFDTYRKELARLVTNVSQLYQMTAHLPAYQPSPDTVRVLDVSDIHDNPAAWNIMHSVVSEFDVSFIVDSGDLTDHGSGPESAIARNIATFHLPYVFIKGNHDSAATQRAVAAQRNAVVLTGSEVTVDGLRIIGAGDPRFTPNLPVDVAGEDSVAAMGHRLAVTALDAAYPPDIAVVHDPAAARSLDGTVKLIIAGHLHRRMTRMLPFGSRLFVQGSTGGAGLRALQSNPPTPLECSVLYFDRATRQLQAWDDITLAGLGGAEVQIQRHLAPFPRSAGAPSRTR